MQVTLNRHGKAKVGRRTMTFPASLAGATVTIPDPEPEDDPDQTEE